MDYQTIIVLVTIAFFAISISFRLFSMTVTALITVVIFLLTGVLTPKEALSGFSDPNVMLVAALYVISTGLMRTHLTKNLGGLIKRGGNNSTKVILMLSIVSVLIFQVLNIYAAIAILLPFALSISSDEELDLSLSQILLPTYMVGAFSLGALPFPKAIQKVAQYNAFLIRLGFQEQLTVINYCLIQIPMTLLSIAFVVLVAWKWMPKKTNINLEGAMSMESRAKQIEENILLSGRKEICCYIICIATIAAMIAGDSFGYPPFLAALIGALVMVISGVLSGNDALAGIQWQAVIMLGSLLPMATAVTKTQVGALAGNLFSALTSGITNSRALLATILLIPGAATQFINNEVANAALTPIVCAASPALSLNPASVIIVMDFACNKIMLLPTVTVIDAMVCNIGGYKPRHEFLIGIVPTLLCVLTVSFLIPLFYPL